MAGESSPTWWELMLEVPVERQDEALAALSDLGWDQSWVEQPLAHLRTDDGWEPTAADPAHVWIHVYAPGDADPAAIAARVRGTLGDLVTQTRTAPTQAQDWLEGWRAERRVVPLRDGWSIAPPWLVKTAPQANRVVVIDPGLAFGAGDHPTTRDTASLLLEWVRAGDRVLDLGAGSGVLALLACLAGAASAVAVELDPLSFGEIDRNARLNRVTAVTGIQGDAGTVPLAGPFDLVLVNIGARLARALRPRIDALTHPDSRVILSGLTEWASPPVAEDYASTGWRTRRRVQAGSEWVTLGLTRS